MTLHDELLANNARYAEELSAGALRVRPLRQIAILTCMDSRYTAQGVLGLSMGDSHVIRNAGGRASDDAIRSLVLSSTALGTRWCVVIHHTDCGLLGVTNDELQTRVEAVTGVRPSIDFLPFEDVASSVRDDVATLRACPYFPPGYQVLGFVYDVTTGLLRSIEA
ncbi:MAG: carbonic anhydrase [Chloroflexi bacterium]|nr:carbonic anhydrase [Chloroflexota bacterium]